MRKLLAVLLSVLMLVSVLTVLPVSAAEPYDKSTAANTPELIVTEIMFDSAADPRILNVDKRVERAFNYIEIYNASERPINLYSLSLVYVGHHIDPLSSTFIKNGYNFNNGKARRVPDSFTLSHGSEDYTVSNPPSAMLGAGQTAILWLWNSQTAKASYLNGSSLGATRKNSNDQVIYFPEFRDFYTHQQTNVYEGGQAVSDDLLIVAVDATDTYLDNPSTSAAPYNPAMYAIVRDPFNIASSTPYDAETNTLDENMLCFFTWGQGLKGLTNLREYYPGRSAIYVPAAQKPDLYNALQKQGNANAVDAQTYLDNGYAISYKQAAILTYNTAPTVGTMEDYQAVYVKPDAYNDTQKSAAVNALLAEFAPAQENDGNRDETKNEVAHVTQDDILSKQDSNIKHKTVKKLTTWGLILIIVGAVVGVAAVAVLVILLLKKKDKKAPDDEEAVEQNEEQQE